MNIPNYICLDIENNNSNRYKRNAGNFLYDEIVAIGIKPYDGFIEGIYNPDDGINQLLDVGDYNLVVGHNIKHDFLFLWQSTTLQKWLSKGGKIWDTAQVEYILTGQQHQYPALRDIAVNKYGCVDRPKHIDNLLFSRKELFKTDLYSEELYNESLNFRQVSDVPKELVLEDVRNDVLDTETIFLKQYEEVVKKGLLPLIESENDMLLFTTELEYNGMYIDPHILKATKYDLEQQLELKKKELDLIIQEVWR